MNSFGFPARARERAVPCCGRESREPAARESRARCFRPSAPARETPVRVGVIPPQRWFFREDGSDLALAGFGVHVYPGRRNRSAGSDLPREVVC